MGGDRGCRSIATIVGASIMSVVLIGFVAFYYFTVSKYVDMLLRLRAAPLYAAAQYPGIMVRLSAVGNNTVVVMANNTSPHALLVIGAVIVFDDDTVLVVDGGSSPGSVRIETKALGSGEWREAGLPLGLAPGDAARITVNSTGRPVAAALALSWGRGVVVAYAAPG
ncbi:MAG: hypothetical protein DSY37_02680 [Hyperthermus sp.]|nr:MAG: hypothetical protein DSY37_02680 [Hyperthermus sp.]